MYVDILERRDTLKYTRGTYILTDVRAAKKINRTDVRAERQCFILARIARTWTRFLGSKNRDDWNPRVRRDNL